MDQMRDERARPFAFRPLESGDETAVRGWLTDYLRQHIAGWTHAYGLDWDAPTIVEHIRRNDLVGREWAELCDAARSANRFVEVALETEAPHLPRAIVHAALGTDRYLAFSMGVLLWIYVDPLARRRSIASTMLQRATAWMRSRGATAAEVFVTCANVPALRSYERAGFAGLDLRMVAALHGRLQKPETPPT